MLSKLNISIKRFQEAANALVLEKRNALDFIMHRDPQQLIKLRGDSGRPRNPNDVDTERTNKKAFKRIRPNYNDLTIKNSSVLQY